MKHWVGVSNNVASKWKHRVEDSNEVTCAFSYSYHDSFFLHRSPLEHVYYDPTDYFDISQHEVDRQDDLEYEVEHTMQTNF